MRPLTTSGAMRNVYMKVMREKRTFITREMSDGKIIEHPEVVENFEALIRVTVERAMGSSKSAHEAAALLIQLGMGKPVQPVLVDETPINDALRGMSDKELDSYTYRILGEQDGIEVCAREGEGIGKAGEGKVIQMAFPRLGRKEGTIAGEALGQSIVETPVIENPKKNLEEENELL